MFQKQIKSILSLFIVISLSVGCNAIGMGNKAQDNLESERSTLQALVVGQQQTITSQNASLFALNGSYNNYTGTSTTSTTYTYITAKSGQTGVWLDDSTGFGGYSSCYLIVEFSDGVIYTQNPEKNGACFSNDSNKGKYNKIVYFANPSAANSYYYCTTAFGKASLAEAKADTTAATVSDIQTGCSSSAWSRIDKR
ncbi:MAG: hypothetical protein H7A24_06525 [Leptospiraceae bacterium]|nr:hypothetical protein [Leptospiraceae bacterium]MCP5511516.1 hypothetical protein [Leptospiraceae bacterium]